jgi:hypothetical protein
VAHDKVLDHHVPYAGPVEGEVGDARLHPAPGGVVAQVDPVGGVVEEPLAGSDRGLGGDVAQRHPVEEQLLGIVVPLVAGQHAPGGVAAARSDALLRLAAREPQAALGGERAQQLGARHHRAGLPGEGHAVLGLHLLEAMDARGDHETGAHRTGIDDLLEAIAHSKADPA